MRGRPGRFYHFLRMRSVYHRVQLPGVMIGTAFMLLLTLLSAFIYIRSTMDLLQEREGRYLSVYSASVNGTLAEIDREISQFVRSDEVQQLLLQSASGSEQRLLRQLRLTLEAELALGHLDAVTDLYLFAAHAEPINLFRGPHGDVDISALDTVRLFYDTSFFAADGSYLVDAAPFSHSPDVNNEGLLCLYCAYETGTARTLGYLMLYLDKNVIFGTLGDAERENQDVCRMLFSESDGLIYATDGSRAAELYPVISPCVSADGDGLLPDGILKTAMCVYHHIAGLDWYVATVIPYSLVASEIVLLISALLVLVVLLFVFYSLLSRSVARSVSIPVNEVLAALHDIQQENFVQGPRDAHADELAEVNNLINDTKKLLYELIGQIRETERQKYELRLEVLRMRINPHFIVNTLNSIIWLASLQGADNIRQLTSALSAMLVPCMRNSSGVAPIQSEIQMLHNYSAIMEFQYMDQFEMIYDIDPEAEEYLAPVLFLQPLVENCLIHGRDLSTPMLTIRITVRKMTDLIRISVSDDGKGISPQRLQELNEREGQKKSPLSTFTSIGMSNIRERMRLLYGERPCSLIVESVENQGTTVKITLPLLTKEDTREAHSAG